MHRAASTPEGVRQVLLELPAAALRRRRAARAVRGFTAVTVPNPHVIAVVGEYCEPDLIELGKRADEAFAEGANVSFLLPLDARNTPTAATAAAARGLRPHLRARRGPDPVLRLRRGRIARRLLAGDGP